MTDVLGNNRGMAMMLTLVIISLLYAVSLLFTRSMRHQAVAAANLKNSLIVGTLAHSGVALGQALLYADGTKNDTDSLHESWASPEYLSEAASRITNEGKINLKIEDLSGKIQINRLAREGNGSWIYDENQKALLGRLLRDPLFNLEEEEAENILDAIKDWIDGDEEETNFGAESSYYKSLPNGYPCKNGPLNFIEELLFVRGIDRELLLGTEKAPGLAQFITVYGEDGKVNINTADPLILQSLAEGIEKKMVEELMRYRENENNDISTPDWITKVLPGDLATAIPSELLSVKSNYFMIFSSGELDSARRNVIAVMKRETAQAPSLVVVKRGDDLFPSTPQDEPEKIQ